MKTLLKWLGIAVTALVCVLLLGASIVYAVSNKHINRRWHDVGATWITVPKDSATVARGRHLGQAIAKCVDCHGEDLGGTMFIDDPGFGRIIAPNITTGRGGHLTRYSDQQLTRLLQHGIKSDGRGAVIMPADGYTHLSDPDLVSIIAWLRSMPPVDREWPAPTWGPVFRALVTFGLLPVFPADKIDHAHRTSPTPIEAGPSPEYGRYLTVIGGCSFCHNPSYSGGKIVGADPKSPPAANLTPEGIGPWTEADFFHVLREGKDPHTGRAIDERYMPWKNAGRMTDEEIHAIWLFLKTLPSKEFGVR